MVGFTFGEIKAGCLDPLRAYAFIAYGDFLRELEVHQYKVQGIIPKNVPSSQIRVLH